MGEGICVPTYQHATKSLSHAPRGKGNKHQTRILCFMILKFLHPASASYESPPDVPAFDSTTTPTPAPAFDSSTTPMPAVPQGRIRARAEARPILKI